MVPFSPTAHPRFVFKNLIELRNEVVPLACEVQASPELELNRIVPWSPTA